MNRPLTKAYLQQRQHPGVVYDWKQTREGIPRFFFWVSGHGDELYINIVELHPEAIRLPMNNDSDEVVRRLYRSERHYPWATLAPIAERAERVCERLNRSTLAVEAAELERGGIKKLFKQCWQEDEQAYG